ncbi:FCD domain-containing protein [Spirosoma sp. HMF4905]|uniref:FCD domain-containing protein n=2 Tax=Spirosoma arboris TaxID=2682092 RepID=A0A7K1SI12_9BACT|nr:FCD domain-containing protein [Spirosoma arboris]
MNTPINRRSLADEVANQIQTYIQSGQYVANQQLPTEPDLMRQYGVGRSTIREAVKMLVNAGLLRVQQGVGTFIEQNPVSNETLHQRLKRAESKDIDEVRQLIEVKIAQKAAINRTQQQLDQIEEFLNQRIQASLDGKTEECIQADINFHLSIAKASGNEILADMYEAFSTRLKSWFLQIYPDTSTFIQTNDLHRSLFLSIKEGNEEKALNDASRILRH